MAAATQKTAPQKSKGKFATTFEANPDADELFVTSDAQPFLKEMWAKSHAKGLEDKAITTVKRDEQEAETEGGEAN